MRSLLRALPFLVISAACLTAAPAPLERKPARLSGGLSCTIRADAVCELGQVPNVSVSITNHTRHPIVLVGRLDGSCSKRRYPHTYFEVIGPDGRSAVMPTMSATSDNGLRVEDFVLVPPGLSFDPFRTLDHNGFFRAHQLSPETFDRPGKYRIRFVYSSEAAEPERWYGANNVNIDVLFRVVPKLSLTSNEITVEVKK